MSGNRVNVVRVDVIACNKLASTTARRNVRGCYEYRYTIKVVQYHRYGHERASALSFDHQLGLPLPYKFSTEGWPFDSFRSALRTARN